MKMSAQSIMKIAALLAVISVLLACYFGLFAEDMIFTYCFIASAFLFMKCTFIAGDKILLLHKSTTRQ